MTSTTVRSTLNPNGIDFRTGWGKQGVTRGYMERGARGHRCVQPHGECGIVRATSAHSTSNPGGASVGRAGPKAMVTAVPRPLPLGALSSVWGGFRECLPTALPSDHPLRVMRSEPNERTLMGTDNRHTWRYECISRPPAGIATGRKHDSPSFIRLPVPEHLLDDAHLLRLGRVDLDRGHGAD